VRISIADIAFYVSNAPALWVLHQLDGLRYRARQGKVSSREGFFAALRAGEGVVSAASTRPGGGAFLQVGVQNVHWLVEVHPNGAAWLDSPHTQRPVAQWLPDVHALASGELAGLAEVNNAPALVFLLPGGGQRTRPLSSADRNAYASLANSSTTTTSAGARSTASSNLLMRRRPRLSLCSFPAMCGGRRCRRSSRASRCTPPRG
jgi:hypothetical protein